jgi:tetratricopeptide (TPR) repeat protein
LIAIVYSNRAMCFLKLRDYGRAEDDSNRALFYKPEYVKALCRRGLAKKALKKLNTAIADFRQALVYEPDNEDARIELKVLEREHEKKVKAAHEQLLFAGWREGHRVRVAEVEDEPAEKEPGLDEIE